MKVNIATVQAIRAIQKNVVTGLSEQTVRETLNHILLRSGLTPYFNVVLFGSDAANPHGGVDESRELVECEFILIDVGMYSDNC
jgi:Xaa-Pro aminopeptidase